MLHAVYDCHHELIYADLVSRGTLTSESAAGYLMAAIGHGETETFWALFLDRHYRLLSSEALSPGENSNCPVEPQTLVARALDLGAAAVIVAQNQPGDDVTVSPADSEATRQLAQDCADLGITLFDHIIVSANSFRSFRAEGLI